MRLTTKEKATLVRAAELIADYEERYSCLAICAAWNGGYHTIHCWYGSRHKYCELVQKYCAFYGKSEHHCWATYPDAHDADERDLRILLVLLFKEAAYAY